MKSDKYIESIDLLKALIEIPSHSREEDKTASVIDSYLQSKGVLTNRIENNIWAFNSDFDPSKPTLLLNSHHDTVHANSAYNRNPYEASDEDDKLFGLGSNDAGGCLVSLIAAFINFWEVPDMSYNLILVASAEEEISGSNGIRKVLDYLPVIDLAIVGEPTKMNLAVSEKGLLVIDGYADGISGHAAHDNTLNPIYKAMSDIEWITNYQFSDLSETLGPVKMNVTQINAGSRHNVVPAECHYVIDVRFNDLYTNKEVFEIIDGHTKSKLVARSFKHSSSSISVEHPIVIFAKALGLETYGSPTMSDQTALDCPSVKIGPGVSARSHTADEFIYKSEIVEGIDIYIKLLESLLLKK